MITGIICLRLLFMDCDEVTGLKWDAPDFEILKKGL